MNINPSFVGLPAFRAAIYSEFVGHCFSCSDARRSLSPSGLQWDSRRTASISAVRMHNNVDSAIGLNTGTSEAAVTDKLEVPIYDANKSRRYVPYGRPPPDRPAPQFDAEKKLFKLDSGLEAQDIHTGKGNAVVQPGTLVVARWSMVLDDGTSLDSINEQQAAMFRPGAHQVPPGVEASVIGMLPGGVRRVKGSSERILTDIVTGYDIGERSLVPNGSTIFIEISVDSIDPYGSR